MSKQIWKYILIDATTTMEIPENGNILSVDEQHGNICIWIEINTKNKKIPRQFEIFGTGTIMLEEEKTVRKFIGTVKLHDSNFIFHVYERLS